MTQEDAIRILLFIWLILKAVVIFTVVYSLVLIKFLWKIVVAVVPILFYFLFAFLGGLAGGAIDAGTRRVGSGRPYHRVWSDEENKSYYHYR